MQHINKRLVFIFALIIFVVVFCCGCQHVIAVDRQNENMLENTVYVEDTEISGNTIPIQQIDNKESALAEQFIPTEPSHKNNQIEPIETESFVEPNDEDFVKIIDYIPTAVVDLKYATEDNFTGQVIYSFNDAWLRYGTVKKLMLVADELDERGLYLKIWDGFRPISAQFTLWDVYPDATYVANPNTGFSSHSRGNTVDLTLVDSNGYELLMPTEFDDFSSKANRNYDDCDEDAASNALILENLMKKHGFEAYYNEWWHYSDINSYDTERNFDPAELG